MTVESVIADEIIARLTPDINAIIGRLDALTAVQLDINTQVRDLRTAIEQAVAECPCDDVAPPPASPPPVVVVPVPEPPSPGAGAGSAPPSPGPVPVTADPPGSVRWRGFLWTVSPTGQILRDGAVIHETSLTSGVVAIWIGADGLLWQHNSAGAEYRWSSTEHWTHMPATSTASITGNGTIAVPSVLSGAVRAP